MNTLGRKLYVEHKLRMAVHGYMVLEHGWNDEIDKLSLRERDELELHSDHLYRQLERRIESPTEEPLP